MYMQTTYRFRELPAIIGIKPVHNVHGDDFFQSFQLAYNEGAVSPGTGQTDVQVVTT